MHAAVTRCGHRLSAAEDALVVPRDLPYVAAVRRFFAPSLRSLAMIALLVALAAAHACQPAGRAAVSSSQRAAITDTLKGLIVAAYDFSKPDVVRRMMSLYPDSGPVVSATAGRITTSRDSLQGQISHFWEYIGQNMREPRWVWGETHVDVLSPDAAVLTATYTVPHIQPNGMSHVIGGAWTALFVRRHGRWVIVQEHLSSATTG